MRADRERLAPDDGVGGQRRGSIFGAAHIGTSLPEVEPIPVDLDDIVIERTVVDLRRSSDAAGRTDLLRNTELPTARAARARFEGVDHCGRERGEADGAVAEVSFGRSFDRRGARSQ